MDEILYGAAYYDEYMPTDRVDTDVAMLQAAKLNVVRIAESTWSRWSRSPASSTSRTSTARSTRWRKPASTSSSAPPPTRCRRGS